MSYPKHGNMAPAFAELSALAAEVAKINERASLVLDRDVRQGVIGQRVRRYGRTYEICQVDVRSNGCVTCYGVTVDRNGRVGTRGFDLGKLEDCEFIQNQG